MALLVPALRVRAEPMGIKRRRLVRFITRRWIMPPHGVARAMAIVAIRACASGPLSHLIPTPLIATSMGRRPTHALALADALRPPPSQVPVPHVETTGPLAVCKSPTPSAPPVRRAEWVAVPRPVKLGRVITRLNEGAVPRPRRPTPPTVAEPAAQTIP